MWGCHLHGAVLELKNLIRTNYTCGEEYLTLITLFPGQCK